MTESTTELFNNFKGTLNDYTATAFCIGTFMSAYKTALDDEMRKQFKQNIRKTINEEIALEKSLDDYIVALINESKLYKEIKNTIESLRKTSYDAGKAYYTCREQKEYERLQSVFSEDRDAFINYMEKELENA